MKSTPETRYSLIAQLRDPQNFVAWNEFASIYQPVVFRLVSARGLQHADATDVTQEVMARVATVVEQFDPHRSKATFRGWLYRITQNITIDFLRKQSRDPIRTGGQLLENCPEIVGESSSESVDFQREFNKQIFWVVSREVRGQVQQNTWRAFWETEIEQRDVQETAIELGMTTGAVYIARSRILARLKKEVRKRLQETGIQE